jgi:hypothetical protein
MSAKIISAEVKTMGWINREIRKIREIKTSMVFVIHLFGYYVYFAVKNRLLRPACVPAEKSRLISDL